MKKRPNTLVAIIISILFLSTFMFLACKEIPSKTNNPTENENTFGYSQMMYTLDRTMGITSVDSMIKADTLSCMDNWIKNPFGKRTQYLFIKSLGENELLYTITTTSVDTLYKCTKRITKTNK